MAEYSENQFLQRLNYYFPDNITQQISPKDIRDAFTDLVDSTQKTLESHTLISQNIKSVELRQTSVGEQSLTKTHLPYEDGEDNSAFGYASLQGNVFGDRNTALGSYSLSCNLDGDCNTAVGYSSSASNIQGNGNVSVGCKTLYNNRKGNYNIAIGHGAGYYINTNTDYQFFLGSHPEASDTDCLDGSGTPLLRGDLQELKLAVGTNEIHNYGTLQVSGDVSPTTSRVSDLGNVNRAWRSVNGMLIFPDPNNVKSNGNIIPCFEGLSLGNPNLRWDGFFRDVNIDGNLTVGGETICGSGSGVRYKEGFFEEDISAPSAFCSPTSGLFREYHTCEGSCHSGDAFYVINRDVNLSITDGTYGQALRHGEEWRPIWVSCTTDTSSPIVNPIVNPTSPPTTTTTSGPTTTTTSGPTTTTEDPQFVASCDMTPEIDSSIQDVLDSGIKSVLISSASGDSNLPTMDFYNVVTDITISQNYLTYACEKIDCPSPWEEALNCVESGTCYNPLDPSVFTCPWGSGFMGIETDSQVIPAAAFNPPTNNFRAISSGDFVDFVNNELIPNWPTNAINGDLDTASGVLVLGYHDRCGPMTGLSGLFDNATFNQAVFDFQKRNGLIWLRGNHTEEQLDGSSCADVENLNYVLHKLNCESRFSTESGVKLTQNSERQNEDDIIGIYIDPYYEGGSNKICVPDAHKFYGTTDGGIATNLFGSAVDRIISVTNPNTSGNFINPILIASGEKYPGGPDIQGQYLGSGVFTMVSETGLVSGVSYIVSEIDKCISCHVAGTKISMPNGEYKNVEEIVVGDKLKTLSGFNTVEAVEKHYLGERKLVSINDSDFYFTHDHPVLTHEGFKSIDAEFSRSLYTIPEFAGNLKIGDNIYTHDGWVTIDKLETISGDYNTPVYHMEISNNHIYFANEIAFHNKSVLTETFCFYDNGIFDECKKFAAGIHESTIINYANGREYTMLEGFNQPCEDCPRPTTTTTTGEPTTTTAAPTTAEPPTPTSDPNSGGTTSNPTAGP